jgi:hypothetical protein
MNNRIIKWMGSSFVLALAALWLLGAAAPPKYTTFSDLVFTNNDEYIWQSRLPTPIADASHPGPPFFIRTNDGSIFWGANIAQDVNIEDTTTFWIYRVGMTDSNDAPNYNFYLAGNNNENYDHLSSFHTFGKTDKDNPYSFLNLRAFGTNGVEDKISFSVDPSGSFVQSQFQFVHHDAVVFLLTGTNLQVGMPQTNSSTLDIAGQLGLYKGTNYINFPVTNTPPVSAVAPVRWVTVTADGTIYRVPLYQ